MLNKNKFKFTSKKEIVYSNDLIQAFKSAIFSLLTEILRHAISHATIKRYDILALLEKYFLLLSKEKTNEDSNVFITTVQVFRKDVDFQKYDIKFAEEADLKFHTRRFETLKEGLYSGKLKMYFQKFHSSFVAAAISDKYKDFPKFFLDPTEKEFFIYNQMVFIQINDGTIRFITDYSFSKKVYVLELKIIPTNTIEKM